MRQKGGDEDGWRAAVEQLRCDASVVDPRARQALQPPNPWRLLQAAVEMLKESRLSEAERIFQALRASPEVKAHALTGLARVARQRGDLDGAAAAWDQAIGEAGDRAEPFWRVENAQVERERGRLVEATAQLEQCRSRHPGYAPAAAALADLLGARDRPRAAAAAWRQALRDFAAEASPWWYMRLVNALRADGEEDEAQRVVADMVERFPDAPPAIVARAEAAMQARDWAAALLLWEQTGTPHTPETQRARGLCLFRLGRAEEAFAVWRDARARWPHSDASYLAAIYAALELGWAEEALAWLDGLIAQAPTRLKPEWLATHGECLLALRRFEAADEAAAAAKARFPSSPTGWDLALRRAELLGDDLASQRRLADEARARFPENGDFLRRYVELALAAGQTEEASLIVANGPDPGDANVTVARWRVIQQRDGIGALESHALRDVEQTKPLLASGMLLGEHLLRIGADWSLAAALRIFEALQKEHGPRAGVLALRVRALVGLKRYEEALEIVDAIPDVCRTEAALEAKAWAAHRRGDEAVAKRFGEALRNARYTPAVHACAPKLERLTSSPRRGGVTAFVPVRDERAMLPAFLRHHRKLGVRRFVCVDNGSKDGGLEYLARQPDVTLYRTSDPFAAAGSGMRWINALIEREMDQGWSLFVDVDERFLFQGCETRGLNDLLRHLEAEGAEGVAAFMLDIFPARLFDAQGRASRLSRHEYFDADYAWLGHTRPPWFRVIGGVRSRLFGVQEYLHKIPLMRSGAGVYLNNHETTPLRLSKITGALAHRKLLALANRWDVDAQSLREDSPTRIPETMRRYRRYHDVFATLRAADLRGPRSRRYQGSAELSDLGLLQAPADWTASACGLSRKPAVKTASLRSEPQGAAAMTAAADVSSQGWLSPALAGAALARAANEAGAEPEAARAVAARLLRVGLITQAERLYRAQAHGEFSHVADLQGLAEVASARKLWRLALRRWNALIAQRPGRAPPYWRAARARALAELGDDAQVDLEEPFASQFRAEAALRGRRWSEALEAGRTALERAPNAAFRCAAEVVVANALIALRRAQEAERYCRAALARQRDHVGALQALMRALARQGRTDAALRAYAESPYGDASAPALLRARIEVLTLDHRFEEARALFADHLRLTAGVESVEWLFELNPRLHEGDARRSAWIAMDRFVSTQPAPDEPEEYAARALLAARLRLALRDRQGFVRAARLATAAQDITLEGVSVRRVAEIAAQPRAASKVFCIGLSKTATTSLANALNRLGMATMHWTNPLTQELFSDDDLDLFDGFADLPVAQSFERYFAMFPKAKFIYTQRPLPDWRASVAAHWTSVYNKPNLAAVRRDLLHKEFPYGARYREVYRGLLFGDGSLTLHYRRHDRRVRDFFADKPIETWLAFDVFAGDGWTELCAFLGRAAPTIPFPKENVAAMKR